MYGIKGGWVGQTFALATCNDSGRKKSRIRRSKEERKAMVETFIKKYQSLNDGNFPSLNLTHKEVGGSFYTVREIVREMIQANRVLGPARLSSEVHKFDNMSVKYPLGSISTEPQSDLFNVENEIQVVPNHQNNIRCMTEPKLVEVSLSLGLASSPQDQVSSSELTLNGNEQFSGHSGAENGQFDNGSLTEESDKVYTESIGTETSEVDREPELKGTCIHKLTNPTAEVTVETFPLRSVNKDKIILDAPVDGSRDLTATVEEVGTKQARSGKGKSSLGTMNSVYHSSGLLNTRAVGYPALPKSGRDLLLIIGQTVADLPDKSFQVPDPLMSKEVSVVNLNPIDSVVVVPCINMATKKIEESQEIAGLEPKNDLSGAHVQNLDDSSSYRTMKDSTSTRQAVIAQEVDIQTAKSTLNGSTPTLDRVDLESWEGASIKSSQREDNPLLALFKAFVSAFVKFWSG